MTLEEAIKKQRTDIRVILEEVYKEINELGLSLSKKSKGQKLGKGGKT